MAGRGWDRDRIHGLSLDVENDSKDEPAIESGKAAPASFNRNDHKKDEARGRLQRNCGFNDGPGSCPDERLRLLHRLFESSLGHLLPSLFRQRNFAF